MVIKYNNSGYMLNDGGKVDPFSNTTIGRSGIHTMQDHRYHESTGNWTVPSGYNPRFHTDANVGNMGINITKDMQQTGNHTFNSSGHPESGGAFSGSY